MANTEFTPILNSALEIWTFLKEQGGLDPDKYDKDIIYDLRNTLSIPQNVNFEKYLSNISNEDFIIAFFQAIQPFSEMMVDILKMFEMACAKYSNKNMSISFNFNENLPELKFDLSHFKNWVETWSRVIDTYLTNLWSINSLWALNSILRKMESNIINQKFNSWYQKYREGYWPDYIPSTPRSGNSEFDSILEKVWKLWTKIVQECMKYGINRNDLRKAAYDNRNKETNNDFFNENNLIKDNWSPDFLWRLESDYWIGSLGYGAYYNVEKINKMSEPQKSNEAKNLIDKIEEVYKHIPVAQFEGEILKKHIFEFLSLPIWKFRHELYSIWVSTQIVNSLSNYDIRIHQINGVLKFSFSGTHLATADKFLPKLHLWSELRSPIANPIGKSRKKSIQPDYSLITDPVTSPEASILEIECKQYIRPSSKNFSDALSDYANARPNALVLLVNYGKVHPKIIDKVDPMVRSRTQIIGNMHPGNAVALEQFRTIVDNSITRCYGFQWNMSELNKLEGEIKLNWEINPNDLDLYLQITNETENKKIYYSEIGTIQNEPWCQLNNDIRNGYGPEIITIKKFINGVYHCLVHNYSNEIPLAGCNANIEFKLGDKIWNFHCPDTGNGRWWSVFSLNINNNDMKEINKIIEDF